MAELTELDSFEGMPVTGTRLVIRNTGDGLSDAMEVAPEVYHVGDEVGVFIRGKVVDVQHPVVKAKKDDETEDLSVTRVHIVRARSAVVLDDGPLQGKLIAIIAKQKSSLDAKREAARGQDQLPGTEATDDED